MVERVSERLKLRLVPAAPQTEDEASATDLVDLGGHLGRQCGVPERHRQDERADLDARRDRCDRGQDGPALVNALGLAILPEDEVVGAPDRVQPVLVGGDRHGPQGRPATGLALGQRQHQSDLHGAHASGQRASAPGTVSG